ncbi:tetratricopeptide repeat protein [Gilvibacter sp.]|uniref:tetratricopeptide repeat protein n=1 Tax=Gilvibacter sp. TaxID=2729997 RepID=UPI0025C3BD6B|nr:tetratricopeptide repeat protein [Gilvibacter sp.]NQX77492.1 tetratricopeptide repeat protein [Gilvibacter sp.]
MRTSLKIILFLLFASASSLSFAQEDPEAFAKNSQTYRADADVAINKDEFIDGEALYRKTISMEPQVAASKYNLGNAYYKKDKNDEAMRRFVQAAEVATSKSEKHKAFHNLGNTLMNSQQYKEAVEAYKNALRNNPTDDETRYNLALAKEMLEKEQQNGGGGEGDDDNEDKDDEDKDEGDQGDPKDDGEQEEQEDQQDQNDQQQQQDQPGDEQEKNADPNKPDKPQEQQQPQQQPGQLSKEQIESLLEAMNNEEQKVQEKMNVKKKKGPKVKSAKDW